jgi:hypothetical protein
MPRFSLKSFFIAITVCAFVLGALFSVWHYLDSIDPFNQRSFVAADWAKGHPEERAAMARDLIRNHLPTGLSRQQLKALLGAPDGDFSPDALKGWPRGTQISPYYLGSWSGEGLDDAFVYVYLDKNGSVIRATIDGR